MSKVNAIRNFEPITVDLGGKTRTLQFDLNAFAELENKYGSIQNAMAQFQAGNMKDVKNVLWASLIHEEAVIDEDTGEPIRYNITPYQVGSWIKNPAMLNDVSLLLNQAMSAGMPDFDQLPPDAKAALEKAEAKN